MPRRELETGSLKDPLLGRETKTPGPPPPKLPGAGEGVLAGCSLGERPVWFPLNSHYLLASGTMLGKAAVAT